MAPRYQADVVASVGNCNTSGLISIEMFGTTLYRVVRRTVGARGMRTLGKAWDRYALFPVTLLQFRSAFLQTDDAVLLIDV